MFVSQLIQFRFLSFYNFFKKDILHFHLSTCVFIKVPLFKSLWLAKGRKESDLSFTISELPPSTAAVAKVSHSNMMLTRELQIGFSSYSGKPW